MNWYILSHHQTLKEIGSKIEQIRLSKNLSKVDLANLSGVDRMTISNIEEGKNFYFDSFVRILRALNLLNRLDELLEPPRLSPKEKFLKDKQKKKH